MLFLNVSERQSGRSGESSTVRYSFDMFHFTAEPHILYLHCTVQLCDRDDLASCTPVSSLFLLLLKTSADVRPHFCVVCTVSGENTAEVSDALICVLFTEL